MNLPTIEIDIFRYRDTFEVWILSCTTNEQLDLMQNVIYSYIESADWAFDCYDPLIVKDVLGYLYNLVDVHRKACPVVAAGFAD